MLSLTLIFDSSLPMASLVALGGSALLSCFRPINWNGTPPKVHFLQRMWHNWPQTQVLVGASRNKRKANVNNRKRMRRWVQQKCKQMGVGRGMKIHGQVYNQYNSGRWSLLSTALGSTVYLVHFTQKLIILELYYLCTNIDPYYDSTHPSTVCSLLRSTP